MTDYRVAALEARLAAAEARIEQLEAKNDQSTRFYWPPNWDMASFDCEEAWSISLYPAVLDDEPQFRAIAMPMPERASGAQGSVSVDPVFIADDPDKQLERLKEWCATLKSSPSANGQHLAKADPDADPWAKIGTSSDDAPADIMESVRKFCR